MALYSSDRYQESTVLSKLISKNERTELHPDHNDIRIMKPFNIGKITQHEDHEDIFLYTKGSHTDNQTEGNEETEGMPPANNVMISGTMNIKEAKVNTILSENESQLAHQVISARINNEDGYEAAQKYITDKLGSNKKIIATTNYSVAVLDKDTGKVTIASRGMNPIKNPADLHNIFNQTLGDNESLHVTRQLIKEIRAKGYEISDVANHSMTGADSITMAFDKGHELIQHTLFDPQITVKNVLEHSSKPTLKKAIKILRNPETFISTPGLMLNNANPFSTNIFETHVLETQVPGIIDSHKMINFTKNQHDQFDKTQIDLLKATNEHVHHEQMADMKQQFIDTGKSFTEYLKDFNSKDGVHIDNVDVKTDGSLGQRINNNSGIVKMWRNLKGNFTEYESQHINSIIVKADGALPVQKEVVDLIKNKEYQKASETSHKIMNKAITAVDTSHIGSHPFVRQLQGAFEFSAMFQGGGAALLTSIIDSYRPHIKNQEGDAAISGGEVGLFSSLFSSGAEGVAGSAVGLSILPAIIGGASAAAAATATSKAVSKLVKNENSDTREAVPVVVSGAVAGGVAVAAADATIGAAALAGVGLGSFGGPIGAAVGVTAGAALGAGYYASHKIAKIKGVPTFTKKVSGGFDEIKDIQVKRINRVKHFFGF